MTRKHCPRRNRAISAPMLVNRGLHNVDIETNERMLIEAFTHGWATTQHFDQLADMRNALTIAASYKDDATAVALCDAMRIPMGNLRERYTKTGRFGLTGDELQLLRVFVDAYRDFWMRQPVSLYEMALDELNRYHQGLSA